MADVNNTSLDLARGGGLQIIIPTNENGDTPHIGAMGEAMGAPRDTTTSSFANTYDYDTDDEADRYGTGGYNARQEPAVDAANTLLIGPQLPQPDLPNPDLSQIELPRPEHQVPSFQGAFAETFHETEQQRRANKCDLRMMDPRERREFLIRQEPGAPPFDVSWRYRPGQEYHEIVRLIAQLSFGACLLLYGFPNDGDVVFGILQRHIDDIDEYLEVTYQDQTLTMDELTKRIGFLKLPMTNREVYNAFIQESSRFRAQIIDGNDKLEAILGRTHVAVTQWDADIEVALRATAVFAQWLQEHEDGTWRDDREDAVEIYDAMKGNSQGWMREFEAIGERSAVIKSQINTLLDMMDEMEANCNVPDRTSLRNLIPWRTDECLNPPHPYSYMPPPPQAVRPEPPSPSNSDTSRLDSGPLESDQETIHDNIRDSRLEFEEDGTESSWRGSLQAPAEGPVQENEFEHHHEHRVEPDSEYDSVADFLREIEEESAETTDQEGKLTDLKTLEPTAGHELKRIPEQVEEEESSQVSLPEKELGDRHETEPGIPSEAQITPQSVYELGPGNRPQSRGTFERELKFGQDHQKMSDGVIVGKFLAGMSNPEKPRPKSHLRERWDLPGGLPLLPPSPTHEEDNTSDNFLPPSPARNSAANFLKRMSDSSTTTDQLRVQSVCSDSDSGGATPEERDSIRNSRLLPAEKEDARGSMLPPIEWSNIHHSSHMPLQRLSIRRSGFRPLDRDLFRDSSWSPTYMLKPQTYTPKLPPPEPSPMLKKDEKPVDSEEVKSTKGKDREYEFLNENPPPPIAKPQATEPVVRKSRVLTLRSRMSVYPDDDAMSKKSSLRSRVSRPPVDISIPPPSPGRTAVLGQSGLSPTHPIPPNTTSVNYDSTYGPDVDGTLRQLRSRGNSTSDLPPGSAGIPIPSPNSENQFYRPVMASPHSPLQQRPNTAAGGIDRTMPESPGNSSGASQGPSIGPSPVPSPGESPGLSTGLSPGLPTGLTRGPSTRLSPAHSARPSTGLSPGLSTTMSSGPSPGQAPYPSPYRSPYPSPSPYHPRQHIRNKPSQILGVTTVNGVTHAVYDTPGQSPHAESPGVAGGSGTGQLKKKKSAFGWFKKAFTMDEDERAAFEQRRSVQTPASNQYYENSSPRFLDGKRIR